MFSRIWGTFLENNVSKLLETLIVLDSMVIRGCGKPYTVKTKWRKRKKWGLAVVKSVWSIISKYSPSRMGPVGSCWLIIDYAQNYTLYSSSITNHIKQTYLILPPSACNWMPCKRRTRDCRPRSTASSRSTRRSACKSSTPSRRASSPISRTFWPEEG